jgi:phosphatidate phosphatase APP1
VTETDHSTCSAEIPASRSAAGGEMNTYGYNNPQGGIRQPGARREKVRGYLKAANELRQSYQAQLEKKLGGDEFESSGRMPGDFPDVEIVRSGDEEMLLFPSYARKHVKTKQRGGMGMGMGQPGTREGVDGEIRGGGGEIASSGDQEYWKREWERFEDENAVVDVDVRGWIYTPQRGPLNRKNRLLVAVARRLSGVPAPIEQAGSRDVSPMHTGRGADEPGRSEEAVAQKQAEEIAKRGEKEAERAWRGSYSNDGGSAVSSRSNSPTGVRKTEFGEDEDPGKRALSKRQSWNQPANMSQNELGKANDLLMARLRPFMTNPLANTTITVFFFNEGKSQSKSVTTNDSGHFNVRAALDFVPTQVRVLASENLSATEDVIITDSRGVSLISDIDDTIKHSAIASGAREIFKNTFIRELGDLTIKGVKEWYTKMAGMGVQLHYVSNSPWQLYPLLRSYFSLAGLPPGSFHLKQYSGMLQGIFEPAAERKKGSIDRIMGDFPERKFILVGDSGEADLEVYTDAVLTYPGRVLGVFIRDVTTPIQQGFFDQSMWNPETKVHEQTGQYLWQTDDRSDDADKRPQLPSRPRSDPTQDEAEDLIDFSDDADTKSLPDARSSSYADDLEQLNGHRKSSALEAPNKPTKPSNLRSYKTQSPMTPPTNHDRIDPASPNAQNGSTKKAPPPPKPRRPSKSVDTSSPTSQPSTYPPPTFPPPSRTSTSSTMSTQSRPQPMPRTASTATTRSTASIYSTSQDEGYLQSARRQLNNAYNALPAIRTTSPTRAQAAPGSDAPPPPPRRGLSSYPAAAARWATGANLGDPNAGGDGGAGAGNQYNKKEEMWKRRWARAEEIMRQRGVVLRTWRVGSDVMSECERLVEKAMWEGEGRGRRGGKVYNRQD